MILKHKILSCIDTLKCNGKLWSSPGITFPNEWVWWNLQALTITWMTVIYFAGCTGYARISTYDPSAQWFKNVVVVHCVATGIGHLQLHFWRMWIHFSTNDNNTFQLYIACESENIRSKGALNRAIFCFEVYQCKETYTTAGKTLWYNTCDKRK